MAQAVNAFSVANRYAVEARPRNFKYRNMCASITIFWAISCPLYLRSALRLTSCLMFQEFFSEFEKLEICYTQFFLINALRSRHC